MSGKYNKPLDLETSFNVLRTRLILECGFTPAQIEEEFTLQDLSYIIGYWNEVSMLDKWRAGRKTANG